MIRNATAPGQGGTYYPYRWSRRRVCYHHGRCVFASWIRPKNFEHARAAPPDRRLCRFCEWRSNPN